MSQDRIILEGMVFYSYHGVSAEEKARGQRIVVDLELATDLRPAGKSDDLKDTVDYGDVYRLVKSVVEGPSHDLIESLAEEIGSRVLADYPVEEVRVKVKKPEVSIKGSILSSAAVEIVRRKSAV
ncbi:MAG: dihydroneopterin aldolase [Dehalococcoidia bacterium]